MASFNLAQGAVAKMSFKGDDVKPKSGESEGMKVELVTSVILATNELTT